MEKAGTFCCNAHCKRDQIEITSMICGDFLTRLPPFTKQKRRTDYNETEGMKIKELFDTSHTIAERIFDNHTYAWEVLPEIGDFIRSLGPLLPEKEYRKIGTDIWVHKSAKVAPTIMMAGPMIICEGANVRHSAFLRGNVIIGAALL